MVHSESPVLKLIDMREVCDMLTVTRHTVYRLMEHQEFPEPIHVGTWTRRWKKHEVLRWIDAQQRAPVQRDDCRRIVQPTA